METRILKALIAFCAAACGLSGGPCGADSLESTVTGDGAGRIGGSLLYRHGSYGFGGAYRQSPDGVVEAMAGVSGPRLAAGHLTDAGIVSEVRNPGAGALSRLGEPTGYRAQLRSVSDRRTGVALMPLDGRLGLAWDRRPGLDGFVAWGTPFQGDRNAVDLYLGGGAFSGEDGDESWYPDEAGAAPGFLGQAAARALFETAPADVGFTLMGSAGETVRPGGLVALSAARSRRPWRIRGRAVVGSEAFRTAEGARLDRPTGFSLDARYRPAKGFRGSAEYQAGWPAASTAGGAFADEGSAGAGWDFGAVDLFVEGSWNRVFAADPGDGEMTLRRAKASASWSRRSAAAGLSVGYEPGTGWSGRIRGAFPSAGPLRFSAAVNVEETDDGPLFGFSSSLRIDTTRGRWTLRLAAADLPRDWQEGPATSGDLAVSLRYLHRWAY